MIFNDLERVIGKNVKGVFLKSMLSLFDLYLISFKKLVSRSLSCMAWRRI